MKVTLPDPLCEKEMVSPVTGDAKPPRVAVQTEEEPIPKLEGRQLTPTVVVFLLFQLTLAEPALPV